MSIYVKIENGVVVNRTRAESAIDESWVESDTAQIGYLYDPETGLFSVPPAPAPEPEPVSESQRLAALTRVAATSAIVAGTARYEDVKMLADLYPEWEAGQSVELDTLLQHQGELYKVIQAHTTQADWSPPSVPALFVSVSEPGVVPEWVQPTGAHDAYALDSVVTHNGKSWKSLHAANVWEPPTQWEEV